MRRWGWALGINAAMLAACNALTGVSDLSVCDTCGAAASDGSDGSSESSTIVDGSTVDRRDGNGPSLDAGDATFADASDADADATTTLGCNGAVACERVVFVTSASYTGNLGGIAGADLLCQARADASVYSRVKGHAFQAWVSTATLAVEARLAHGTMAYVDPTGAVIANGWNDLTDGDLASGIEIDELGVKQSGNAWTGTNSNNATYAGSACTNWTSAVAIFGGERGNVGGSGNGWSSSGAETCSATKRLYCFEK